MGESDIQQAGNPTSRRSDAGQWWRPPHTLLCRWRSALMWGQRNQHIFRCATWGNDSPHEENAYWQQTHVIRPQVGALGSERLDVRQGEAATVFGAEEHLAVGNAPVDGQRWVVEAERGFGLGGVDVVDLVLELRHVAEHHEAVGKATGNEELVALLGAEFHGHMMAEGGAAATQVDGHIEHTALRHAHEFGLTPLATLEVQPAQHTIGGERLIVLHKRDRPHVLPEFLKFERLAEVASLVSKAPGLNHPHALDVGLDIFHRCELSLLAIAKVVQIECLAK